MALASVPSEILIQILDDPSLELGDLAVISRVSRRWHEAVVPVLYRRFTFQYHHPLRPLEEKKLRSFQKHGCHVKYLNVHVKEWSDHTVDHPHSSAYDFTERAITRYIDILKSFPEVTHVEHYDIEVRNLNWSDFWVILNHLVSQKSKLVSLTIRRNLNHSINPSSEHDLSSVTLEPTPPLPDFRALNLRINNGRAGPEIYDLFPCFLANLVTSLGDSCKNVTKLSFHVNISDTTELEKLELLRAVRFPRLAIDSIKELKYEVQPGAIPPSNLINTEFHETKSLTASYWVCEWWLHQLWEQLEPGQTLDMFKNLEVLCITDEFPIVDNNINTSIEEVTKHLPSLKSLILEDDDRQFSISRKLDGSPIWQEVPYLFG